MRAHHAVTEEGDKLAVENARILVENAIVPLLIRARACMILGYSVEDDALVWAKEGVRVAELIVEVSTKVGEAEEKLLGNCREVLEAAEERAREEEEWEREEEKGDDEKDDEHEEEVSETHNEDRKAINEAKQ